MKVEAIKNEKNNSLRILIFLNLFDGILTYIGLRLGFYTELNKMLNAIYSYNHILFVFVKIIIPTIVLMFLLNKLSKNISVITKTFIIIGNGVYSMLFIYHIILISTLIA